MRNDDQRHEMIAAAASAMAARNVAIASARFGYVPPERPVTAMKPPIPTPAPATVNHEALVREAERCRAEAKAAKEAEIKASWDKVVAKMNGKPAKSATAPDPANPWSSVVAKMNARHATSPAETRATPSGWAAVIADFNARRGR